MLAHKTYSSERARHTRYRLVTTLLYFCGTNFIHANYCLFALKLLLYFVSMDSLKDLPVDDKDVLSDQQRSIMAKYMGGSAPTKSNTSGGASRTSKWKMVMYITGLFLALVNPISQGLLSKVPYVNDSYIIMLALTALLFAVGTAIVMYIA